MVNKEVHVEILEHKGEQLKVKLPFLHIPVTMNESFFNRRVRSGYFIPSKAPLNRNKKQLKA